MVRPRRSPPGAGRSTIGVVSGTRLPLAADGGDHAAGAAPVLLVVSPDLGIARGTEQELRREFADDGFEAACVGSASAALELLRGVRERDGQVALLVADQQLRDGTGVELIARARELFRELRTVLITDYSEIDAAIGALGPNGLDHFFIKPLGPADEQILPVAADLLTDWQRWASEAARAVRIVATPHCDEAHRLRDFLRRNDIHHRLLVVGEDPEALVVVGDPPPDSSQLPVVLVADGTRLVRPSPLQLAEQLGLPTRASRDFYDLAIVGGGPAGLAAAVYAASEGLTTVILERDAPGGQAGQSARIENYLGFPSGLRGGDLAQRALRQGRRFGAEIVRMQDAVGLEVDGDVRRVRLSGGGSVACHCAVVSCGVSYRRLEAEGTDDLLGRGVFYGAATTEAERMRGRRVFVVGGANSAGQGAIHFAQYADHVTVVVRGESLEIGMSQYLVDRIAATPNIDVLTRTRVTAAGGEGHLENVTLQDLPDGPERTLPADGLFIFIGAVPHTEWLQGSVACDDRGFILSGREGLGSRPGCWPLERDPFLLETSVPGVFAAGDVRQGSLKRVASAVGEGAMAVQFIHHYLAELRQARVLT